ncbi:MDR family MFS transporter [Paenibacillus sp. GCM10027626]|uniref:MDR family MFS transporter n=1 Tax=Paenibacillus sp. GCM10027626 TaxID=3273411 RepID=UPI00363DB9AC
MFVQQKEKSTAIKPTIVGLMLALLLVSLDQTILATAVPTIVSKLGGLEQYVWVFSAYLIASAAGMPMFGKLSDMYGRKLFFLLGLALFIIGSALCGTAGTMTELIIYRAVQGVGGGALMPVIFVIIFDLFPKEKRGKVQGLFGAVFGLSSVFGPLAGAFFTDHLHWRWIFYINLPLGLIAFWLVLRCYHEKIERAKRAVDWLGTITLLAAVLAVMFALELGGQEYSWQSPLVLSLFAGAALLLILFVIIEHYNRDPIVPLPLFKNRLFTASLGIGFFYGAALMTGASLIPMFIQGVIGGTATNAGLVLTPMMIAVVVSSFLGGTLARRFSYRAIMLVSAAFLVSSAVLLSILNVDSGRGLITLCMILLGLAIGASFPISSIAAQHNIGYQQRGVVNSLVRFSQTLGNTLGIAVFGSLQATRMAQYFAEAHLPAGFKPQDILQLAGREQLPPDLLQQLAKAMSSSLTDVFLWMIPLSVLAILFVILLGNAKMMTSNVQQNEEVNRHVYQAGHTGAPDGRG